MIKTIALLSFLLTFVLTKAQTDHQFSPTISYMKGIVKYLASDTLRGRASGSKEEVLAADFIVAKFAANKACNVKRQRFSIKTDSSKLHLQNILCFIDNGSANTVLIMAHYDHLGMGGAFSHSKGVSAIHNGADDNASGVALMLEMAKILSQKKSNCNFLFAAFSGHEIGLYGSNYLSNHLSPKYKTIALSINLDMVGRMDADQSLYYDCTQGLEINSEDTLFSNIGLWIQRSQNNRLLLLDSKYFALKGIPSITISTGIHSDYHKISDDEEYINYTGMEKIKVLLLRYLQKLNYY